jgi:hypothetical protein
MEIMNVDETYGFYELQNASPCSHSPPLDPILNQLDQVHTITFYSLKIRVNTLLGLSLSLPCGVFRSGFPH